MTHMQDLIKNSKILVTGGAGFIGSHMCKALSLLGHEVDVIDNLSTGFKSSIKYGHWLDVDLLDLKRLTSILHDQKYDCIFHFASFIEVEESVKNPIKFYFNNFVGALNLIDAMQITGHKNMIFSSSAAVYGDTNNTHKIREISATKPINPYGQSKLMIENALEDANKAYGINSVRLRYFNAAGADSNGELGESHDPESHLVPILAQFLAGKRERIYIYGTDYDTKDGTCVRDFVHVEDLVHAHIRAWEYLKLNNGSIAINLGSGVGTSIKEIIDFTNSLVPKYWEKSPKILPIPKARRAGDSAVLVADIELAHKVLNWQPRKSLEDILVSTINWEMKKQSRPIASLGFT